MAIAQAPLKATSKNEDYSKKIQDIHKRRYLSGIRILPDLRSKTTQKYLEVILTLVALTVAGLFAILPTFTTIASLQKQLQDAQLLYQKLETKKNNLAALYSQYYAIDLSKIYSALPQTDQPHLFVALLQALAQQDQLSVQSLDVSPQTIQSKSPSATASMTILPTETSKIVASLDLTGTPENMEKFLNDVVTFQRMTSVQIASITRQDKNKPLSLSVTVVGYSMP